MKLCVVLACVGASCICTEISAQEVPISTSKPLDMGPYIERQKEIIAEKKERLGPEREKLKSMDDPDGVDKAAKELMDVSTDALKTAVEGVVGDKKDLYENSVQTAINFGQAYNGMINAVSDAIDTPEQASKVQGLEDDIAQAERNIADAEKLEQQIARDAAGLGTVSPSKKQVVFVLVDQNSKLAKEVAARKEKARQDAEAKKSGGRSGGRSDGGGGIGGDVPRGGNHGGGQQPGGDAHPSGGDKPLGGDRGGGDKPSGGDKGPRDGGGNRGGGEGPNIGPK